MRVDTDQAHCPSADDLVVAHELIAEIRSLGAHVSFDEEARLLQVNWLQVPLDRCSQERATLLTVRMVESVAALTEILSAEGRVKH